MAAVENSLKNCEEDDDNITVMPLMNKKNKENHKRSVGFKLVRLKTNI